MAVGFAPLEHVAAHGHAGRARIEGSPDGGQGGGLGALGSPEDHHGSEGRCGHSGEVVAIGRLDEIGSQLGSPVGRQRPLLRTPAARAGRRTLPAPSRPSPAGPGGGPHRWFGPGFEGVSASAGEPGKAVTARASAPTPSASSGSEELPYRTGAGRSKVALGPVAAKDEPDRVQFGREVLGNSLGGQDGVRAARHDGRDRFARLLEAGARTIDESVVQGDDHPLDRRCRRCGRGVGRPWRQESSGGETLEGRETPEEYAAP